jgi:hypothetical protein
MGRRIDNLAIYRRVGEGLLTLLLGNFVLNVHYHPMNGSQ